jgi:hypothetical protein
VTYPRWIWADAEPFTPGLRVELACDRFVDYVRTAGVWRQKTRPMTDKESVTPERYWLNDWRTPASEWPVVDVELGEWLETTYEGIS